MTTLTAFIPGVPAPQGSKTAVLRGRRPVLIEASKTTAPWRATVTAHVRQAMTGQINGPVQVACVFYFTRPASHFGTGRNAGMVRPGAPSIYKASKPDLDKLLRAVLDGVTDAGAWRDDSQVAQLSAVKRWADAETPGGGVHLTISELHDREVGHDWTYEGRVEITWTNQHRRLLARDDNTYEWVPAHDERVSEVRLLDSVAVVGPTHDDEQRAADNLLIRGDALHALRSLASLPEFRDEYLGKVKLCYIDPPFNSLRAFAQYDDALKHSVWLTMIRDRLEQIWKLLADDGVVWLHLDNNEVHRARMVLDGVFGEENYRNTVIWRRTTGKSAAVRNLGTMHDTLLVYAKTAAATFRPMLLPYDEKYLKDKYSGSDDKGLYTLGDLTAPGLRKGDSGEPWRGIDVSARRRHWAAPQLADELIGPSAAGMATRQKLDALAEAGFVQTPGKPGAMPRFKRYLDEEGGVALGDLWTDITVLNSQSKERLGFDTQKPEQLVERIVRIATDPGDIVLDCFVGSGTTAAVAHKLGRRWVACEREQETVEHYVMPRLESVVAGRDPSGITKSAGWEGGGGFRVLDVHPSMFERTSDDRVVVASWAAGGALAEAVAAQAAFPFDAANTIHYTNPTTGRTQRRCRACIRRQVRKES